MLGSGYVSRVCFEVCFGVCFGGMFRGIMSYFACNFRGMLRGMFRGYVSGYVTGYVSRVCNPCALLKPEPPQKNTNPYGQDRSLRRRLPGCPLRRTVR